MKRTDYSDEDVVDALVDYQLTGPVHMTLHVLGAHDGTTVISALNTKTQRVIPIATGATFRQAVVSLIEWREKNPYDPKIHG